MSFSDKNDCELSEEKACSAFFIKRWRHQLLIHETQGDADAIELDRRMLDYYLDWYNQLAKRQQQFQEAHAASLRNLSIADSAQPGIAGAPG